MIRVLHFVGVIVFYNLEYSRWEEKSGRCMVFLFAHAYQLPRQSHTIVYHLAVLLFRIWPLDQSIRPQGFPIHSLCGYATINDESYCDYTYA